MIRKQSSDFSRRRFLKTAGATSLAVTAPAITIPGRAQPKTLKILSWKSIVASADQWETDFARDWGEQNNIQVILDRVSMGTNTRQTETEFTAGQGHDLYYYLDSPAVFEAQLIDHREIYQECERRYGKVADMAVKSRLNPKTNRFLGFLDGFVPVPVIYRKDLWDSTGRAPDSWDDVRFGGRRVKFLQGPFVGISLGLDLDAEGSWRALLYSFGGSEQDADNRPALKSAATLEALKFAKALYDEAMPEDIFTWDNTSNNRTMLAGESSLTLNPISIIRTGENKQFAVTDQLWLAATPAGPAHRLAPINGDGAWLIPTFSQNIEAAQRYLVDYIGHSREWFLASRFFALPTFPQTVPDMPQLLASDSEATPADKYKILADALNWTTNFGYPGYNNPAIGDIYNSNLIPTMFANVASAKMTPEEAMTQADQEVRKIFQKWQDLGKV